MSNKYHSVTDFKPGGWDNVTININREHYIFSHKRQERLTSWKHRQNNVHIVK